MLPKHKCLICRRLRIPIALNNCILCLRSICCVSSSNMSSSTMIVTRQSLKFILIAVYIYLDIFEVTCHIFNLGAINQLLPFEDPPQQPPYDHQYNGQLDTRKARSEEHRVGTEWVRTCR